MKRFGMKTAIVVLAVVLLTVVVPFLLVGPPRLLAKSDSPGFCAGCHVMEYEFSTWRHSGSHRSIRCVDCHLPNSNLLYHYIGKSISGLKDAFAFYSGRIPDPIVLSPSGASILRKNCIRCHAQVVSMISQTRNCWDCHRGMTHRRGGLIETR